MSTAFLQSADRGRFMQAMRFHFQNAATTVRRFSPWVLLVPAGMICLIVLDARSGFGWIQEKATQEIVAPSILAVAVCLALLFWARAGAFCSRWLVLLTGVLFCRELHFWGTNNGIYLAMILLLWYASRNIDAMRPMLQSRTAVSLFGGALCTYALTKTFDRAYWTFIVGWKDWQDTMEESLESTAHLLVLSLVVVSYAAWGRQLRRGDVKPSPLRRRLRVWGLMATAAVAGAVSFNHWFGDEEKRSRPIGGFPIELSSLCNVNPELGEQLFLASSDEEHKLTLWSFADTGKPTVLKHLALNVPMADGGALHLDDLEDIAWDGRDTYYAVCSHRHLLPKEDAGRMKKSHGTECALVRFQLVRTDEEIVVANTEMISQDLLSRIRDLDVFPSIDWKSSKVFSWRGMVKTWQLNIEGLAAVDGKLLLGFKDPIEDGKATILSYDPAIDELAVAARPGLDGQGILGMHYDPTTDRLLVLSNDPIKHRYGDSCLWVGRRSVGGEKSWTFSPSEKFVLEPSSAKTQRKASGVTVAGNRLIVCFDSEAASPIKTFDVPEALAAQKSDSPGF